MRLILLLWMSVASSVGAATYYIDATGGSDAAAGTSSGAAWQTISHASTNYTTGDTLFLKRGETWNEGLTNNYSSVILDAYGSGAMPILDGQTVRRKIIYHNATASNTITRNLHLKNAGGGTGANWECTVGTNTVTDCVVQNNVFDALIAAGGDAHIIVQRCYLTEARDDGVTLHATASAMIENCTFTNNYDGLNNSGTGMEMTVNDCLFINNTNADIGPLSHCTSVFNRCRFAGRAGGGVQSFYTGGSDTTTAFNYCTFDAQHGASASPGFGSGTNTVLRNCVFFGANSGGLTANPNTTISATNCIFLNWYRAAFIFSGGVFNVDHCMFKTLTTTNWTTSTSMVSTTADPLFVSPSTGDFRLQSGSPAINAGVNVGLLSDLAGSSVGNPPEVGAFEQTAPSVSPNIPRVLGLKWMRGF